MRGLNGGDLFGYSGLVCVGHPPLKRGLYRIDDHLTVIACFMMCGKEKFHGEYI